MALLTKWKDFTSFEFDVNPGKWQPRRFFTSEK